MPVRFVVVLLSGLAAAAPPEADELTPFGVPLISQGFESINVEAGITVYKDPESDNIRLAAEGVVAASPDTILRALMAYEEQPELFGNVSEARILVRGERRLLLYQRLDIPILDDRDGTLWITWGRDGDTRWLRHRLARNRGPAASAAAVRVPYHQGSWQIRPLDGGRRSMVRFQVNIDLAGWVPRWIARTAAGDDLPGVFADICKVAARLGTPCGEARDAAATPTVDRTRSRRSSPAGRTSRSRPDRPGGHHQ